MAGLAIAHGSQGQERVLFTLLAIIVTVSEIVELSVEDLRAGRNGNEKKSEHDSHLFLCVSLAVWVDSCLEGFGALFSPPLTSLQCSFCLAARFL